MVNKTVNYMATTRGVFEALANEHRRHIVSALSLEPHSISGLASMRGLSLPAIHRHVRALEDAGMLVREKVGRTNILELNRAPLQELRDWLRQLHSDVRRERMTLEQFSRHLGQ